ncbi:methyltransferase domain-containing protein [bacterium]|nr:methyltransferase domain-containing protein [bacterium]
MIELESTICPVCGAPSGRCSCLAGYSEGFRELLSSEEPRALIEGSHVSNCDFREWEHERRFLASTIHRDGSVLDIGCANGFFLRSLQEWSGRKLDPYGIDVDAHGLDAAREMFPNEADHFVPLGIQQLDERAACGLPEQFDFVYWNVWDNFELNDPSGREALRLAWEAVAPGGRLVLGLYHSDRQKNLDTAEFLRFVGYTVAGVVEHPEGRSEVAIFLDKPSVAV